MSTRDTKRGYEALGGDDEKTVVRVEPVQTVEKVEKVEKAERKPPLDVQITRVRGGPGRAIGDEAAGLGPVFEIWTRNTIYLCDVAFVCVEVRDRATGRPEARHAVLGAKLLGGHKRYAKTLHLVRPLPLPGTQAVFLRNNVRRDAQAYTSAVERVVFNYHAVALELSTDPQDAWADVTNMNLR